ncbi:MAG: AraC family transcriptional regulator [Burkholderiaceae bacterium]|nr:AraC family transcriptional regulator [Burkholderiaceae bacterium]
MTKILKWSSQAHGFQPHFHTEFFISTTLQGQCHFECEGKSYTAKTGDISLIPPFHVHTAHCTEDMQYFAVYLAHPGIHEWMTGESPGIPVQWETPYVVSDNTLAQKLREAMVQSTSHSSATVAKEIIQKYARQIPPDASSLGWRVRSMHWMRESLLQNDSIASMARHMNMSHQGFSRAFQKYFGVTPIFFRNQIKLEIAENLLLQGNKPIDVATMCGFSDQAHLNRVLKASRGHTPGKYARNYFPFAEDRRQPLHHRSTIPEPQITLSP